MWNPKWLNHIVNESVSRRNIILEEPVYVKTILVQLRMPTARDVFLFHVFNVTLKV